MLKYCPKRLEFDWPVMQARTQLAALDNNFNADREYATVRCPTANSGAYGERRYRQVWSKVI